MRSLSDAEVRVLRVLLAGVPGPERRSVLEADVPRSTFQSVRRRAFVHGWLKERYLPDPALFGTERVRFFLAQPYTEQWSASMRALRALDDLVLLWASPETLFGVVFEGRASSGWEGLRSTDSFRRSWTVAPATGGDGVVSYFDYEGVWSRGTRESEPLAYPRGFPVHGSRGSPVTRGDWVAVRGLLVRPFEPGPGPSEPRWFSPSRLSRHERRLLREGWLVQRLLPDFNEIPSWGGYRPERVVFITGLVRPGGEPRRLFENLTQEARAAPFLFVYDADRVLLGTMSPAPAGVTDGRHSVVEVLERDLERIEVVREPIASLFPAVDHRYDRLPTPKLPTPPAPGNGGDRELNRAASTE